MEYVSLPTLKFDQYPQLTLSYAAHRPHTHGKKLINEKRVGPKPTNWIAYNAVRHLT